MAFSPDNSKVVFHSNALDHLGKSAGGGGESNSFVMDIESGAILSITQLSENQHSEFPAFCGNQGIVTRVTDEGDASKTRFELIKIPSHTGKTPLSLFLSHKSWKGANVTDRVLEEAAFEITRIVCQRMGIRNRNYVSKQNTV